jgi:methionyl-tRNA formyltransferase
MDENLLCLAGDGWGAIAAYRSLREVFINIDVLTSDEELTKEVQAPHNVIENFNQTNSNLIICAGYKPIISQQQLIEKKHINIHYSMLPKYRGLHSTVWAILNDEKELGLSIHIMNEFIDDGPILYQHSIANDGKSSSRYYMEYFNKWIEDNLGLVIEKYIKKEITPYEQDKSLATWVGRRKKNDCKIDFSKDHFYLKNFFRALVAPYPLPYIELLKSRSEYSIQKVTFLKRDITAHIGRIVNIDAEGVYVSSKDGYVVLNEILDQDNQAVEYSRFKIGTFLNQEFL